MQTERSLLRIERKATAPDRTTLKLAGRLAGADLAMLRDAVEACLGAGRPLELDLADLRFLDEPAARLLVALEKRGALLSHARGYAVAMLRAMQEEK